MRIFLATAALVLAGTGVGRTQAAGSCGDVINDPAATCPSVLAPSAGGSVDSGSASVRGSSGAAIGQSVSASGTAVDRIFTDAIPDVPKPDGMAPLDVPTNVVNPDKTDRLGGAAEGDIRQPFGNSGPSSRRNAISSPSIR